jgi:pilus assembly protein CpaE
MAFITDDATLQVVQTVTDKIGWRAEASKKGGLQDAVQALSVANSPTIMMIDLSETAQPLNEIESLAEVCEPGTIVFALGRINDVTLYRELMARGVRDYLVKPLSASQLQDALERAREALAAPRENSTDSAAKHLAVAVVGTRGGVGASTVATSLAWLLSDQHQRSTALLDLDVHFGTGALALDLEPGRGLTDAIDDPSRIDGLFIERAMVRASDRLAVMSAEAPLNAGLMGDGSAFLRLQHEFGQAFQATVVDCPRSTMLNFPQLLAEVGTVVLTTELTLASARDAIRILAWLKSNAPDARIVMVANKVQTGAVEIGQSDFCAAIERSLDIVVPFDPKGAVQAAKLGQTFAEANLASKSGAAFLQLAQIVADAPSQAGEARERTAKPASLLAKLDLRNLLAKRPVSAERQPARSGA